MPEEIPRVFKSAIGPDPTDHRGHVFIARRMREALVKTAAVGGLPKTINALLHLKTETPTSLLDTRPGSTPTSRQVDLVETEPMEIIKRGREYFDKTYGKIAHRVMEQMRLSGTEDLDAVARLFYGHIVSNTDILSPVETSYALIAAIIPQDVNPQLKGHLKGALNHGATNEEVQAVRKAVIEICKAAGMSRLPRGTLGGWGWKSEIAT
ncbi:uncharacterized protein N7503_000424 [Penicillium pulvis]|uniref:uncharacterized protein n=1 Tax=Penicillium pulvis TaxID=1562058 RepID=UPI00254762C0|nr:uncharacterized protein N7503_000424 [Penicillium pulvis]KAJ5813674.1 hypothetical protein N7503_000424 [Penicillium pulvis]